MIQEGDFAVSIGAVGYLVVEIVRHLYAPDSLGVRHIAADSQRDSAVATALSLAKRHSTNAWLMEHAGEVSLGSFRTSATTNARW